MGPHVLPRLWRGIETLNFSMLPFFPPFVVTKSTLSRLVRIIGFFTIMRHHLIDHFSSLFTTGRDAENNIGLSGNTTTGLVLRAPS